MTTVTGLAMTFVLVASMAGATPVAKTRAEREAMGRSFLEPVESTNFIQLGVDEPDKEFAPAFELLEKLFPRYAEYTTVDEELNDPNAVSVGPDGWPAWDKRDTGDGLPFDVAYVTDKSVPDHKKEYVLFTVAHSAEPCGREGAIRFLEDLLIWREEDPGHKLTDQTGLGGDRHKITVKELLERTKIFFVNVAPDGWSEGDGYGNMYSQSNGAGINNNRVAFQDGWVFPPDKVLYQNGYSVLTQPEGAAVTKYLRKVRDEELRGRPFAVASDMHGPLPTGAILLHDQGNTPAKLQGVHDLAERIKQAMDEVFASYFTEHGLAAHQIAARYVGQVRDEALRVWSQIFGGQDEKAAYLTLQWAEYATIWEHIDYTVSGSYGGWANSEAGLGAESISFEIDCLSYEPWNPALMQLFTDNIRAIAETSSVHAAMKTKPVKKKDLTNLKAKVGFYESGKRVTDADGNPSAPPRGFPNNALVRQILQTPYDVSNTDYFRDLGEIVSSPIVEVRINDLGRKLSQLDSFVVADTALRQARALKEYVRGGGNLILTDAALRMVPELVDIDADLVQKHYSYVGYSDLIREHPMTEGLYERARQMFDPIGLGYELLMERDQYWPCGNGCEESPTKNSAPIWTIDRAAWEAAGGETVGTADPPEDRKGRAEGTETDKTSIGVLPMGKGNVIVFGALLPQATERYSHWFGVNGYTVSIPGQQLLLKALRWEGE
jgi:hypothetical protein